jgi:hypothetical protein
MELKVVDLQCCRCYKKVKKVLCKFPRESHSLSQSFCMCRNVRACCAFGCYLTWLLIKQQSEKEKDWVSFYVVLNFFVQEKYKTRYTTRSKTRWQSKWWAAVPKRLCKRYAARVVNALSAFRSYRLLARSLCLYRFAYQVTRLVRVVGHVIRVVVGARAFMVMTSRAPVLVVVVGLGVATWAASRSPVLVVVVGLGVATWAAVITFVKKIHQNAESCKWKCMLVSSVMRCYTYLGLLFYSCFIGL